MTSLDRRVEDSEWLRQKYHKEGLTQREIADIVGCAHKTISNRMREFGISTTRSLEDRFQLRVEEGDEAECWEMRTGDTDTRAKFRVDGRVETAPRAAYLIRGTDPGEKQVNHTCDNPLCVNMNHLYIGTQSDNLQDAIERGRVPDRDHSGENNPNSKLSEDEVQEIRKRDKSAKELSDEYDVSIHTIYYIWSGGWS